MNLEKREKDESVKKKMSNYYDKIQYTIKRKKKKKKKKKKERDVYVLCMMYLTFKINA